MIILSGERSSLKALLGRIMDTTMHRFILP